MSRKTRITLVTLLATAAAGAAIALLIHDQIRRHRRDLFSTSALERLAALGHMARESPSVDNVRLLRDFIAWEPRRMLRERARSILVRMENQAASNGASEG